MITGDQILAHLVGDYLLQSDWMAQAKTKSSIPALAHVATYSLPFLLCLQPSITAFLFLVVTHFLIDRYRLARFVCYGKNMLAPPTAEWCYPWSECSGTGYHSSRPPWLAFWLLIITDNTMHIICNGIALTYL